MALTSIGIQEQARGSQSKENAERVAQTPVGPGSIGIQFITYWHPPPGRKAAAAEVLIGRAPACGTRCACRMAEVLGAVSLQGTKSDLAVRYRVRLQLKPTFSSIHLNSAGLLARWPQSFTSFFPSLFSSYSRTIARWTLLPRPSDLNPFDLPFRSYHSFLGINSFGANPGNQARLSAAIRPIFLCFLGFRTRALVLDANLASSRHSLENRSLHCR
jgi:hypothetical protein